jgi:hypothetical protein
MRVLERPKPVKIWIYFQCIDPRPDLCTCDGAGPTRGSLAGSSPKLQQVIGLLACLLVCYHHLAQNCLYRYKQTAKGCCFQPVGIRIPRAAYDVTL